MEPITITGFMGLLLMWLIILIGKELVMIIAERIVDGSADLGRSMGQIGKKLGDSISKMIKGLVP